MNKKTIVSASISALVAVFTVTGIAYAASIDATSKLGGSAGDFFNFNGTGVFGSIKIGSQGSGGVTFFNGTIINDTTTSGADNPVTFGDNVRIDGRVWRGATSGSGDGMPFIVKDDLEVEGDVTFGKTYGSVSVNHYGIKPYDNDQVFSASVSGFYNDAGSTSDFYYAPVSLPDGASITKLTAYINDNSASDLTVKLFKNPNGTSTFTEITSVVSTGASGSTQSPTIIMLNPEAIDNTSNSYVLQFDFDG